MEKIPTQGTTILKQTQISMTPYVLVSTIFLPIDHSFLGGEPAWFETMVFLNAPDTPQGGRDYDMARYATYSEAIAGHEAMVLKWGGNAPDDQPDPSFDNLETPDDHEG